MFKANDKVVVVRLETSVRQRTKHDPPGLGDWITEKPKVVERKAVIGQLGRLYIPVRLPDKRIKKVLYPELTFTKAGVSFKSRLPNWKGIKNGKEVLIPGKPVTVRGKAVLSGLYIPVVLNGKTVEIPYENLEFKRRLDNE